MYMYVISNNKVYALLLHTKYSRWKKIFKPYPVAEINILLIFDPDIVSTQSNGWEENWISKELGKQMSLYSTELVAR